MSPLLKIEWRLSNFSRLVRNRQAGVSRQNQHDRSMMAAHKNVLQGGVSQKNPVNTDIPFPDHAVVKDLT